MKTLIESLRRLYKAGKVAVEKLEAMKTAGKITDEEYAWIIK